MGRLTREELEPMKADKIFISIGACGRIKMKEYIEQFGEENIRFLAYDDYRKEKVEYKELFKFHYIDFSDASFVDDWVKQDAKVVIVLGTRSATTLQYLGLLLMKFKTFCPQVEIKVIEYLPFDFEKVTEDSKNKRQALHLFYEDDGNVEFEFLDNNILLKIADRNMDMPKALALMNPHLFGMINEFLGK